MYERYGIHYAEGVVEDNTVPPQLFAGDTPAVSTRDVAITNAAAIGQFVPLQANETTGAYEPWEAGNEIVALTAYDIAIGTARSAVYTAGCFNLDAIQWPADTTEAQVQAATTSSQVVFRKLLYSNKRTGNEGAPGIPAGPTV